MVRGYLYQKKSFTSGLFKQSTDKLDIKLLHIYLKNAILVQ